MAKESKESKKDTNPYVSKAFCDERFQRVLDQFSNLQESMQDVKKTSIEKAEELKKAIKNIKAEEEETSHFWRNLAGTIVGGAIVAILAILLSRL
jgi:hypothetical protein